MKKILKYIVKLYNLTKLKGIHYINLIYLLSIFMFMFDILNRYINVVNSKHTTSVTLVFSTFIGPIMMAYIKINGKTDLEDDLDEISIFGLTYMYLILHAINIFNVYSSYVSYTIFITFFMIIISFIITLFIFIFLKYFLKKINISNKRFFGIFSKILIIILSIYIYAKN